MKIIGLCGIAVARLALCPNSLSNSNQNLVTTHPKTSVHEVTESQSKSYLLNVLLTKILLMLLKCGFQKSLKSGKQMGNS